MCMMHYHRVYRTGSVTQKPKIARMRERDGYMYLGNLRVHRHTYMLEHQEPPPCWSCGMELSWDMGKKMHIDHIDEDKLNNDIKNLRASCWQCNVMRRPWALD